MLIHHSFGFPNIFLKGGHKTPRTPPGSAPEPLKPPLITGLHELHVANMQLTD